MSVFSKIASLFKRKAPALKIQAQPISMVPAKTERVAGRLRNCLNFIEQKPSLVTQALKDEVAALQAAVVKAGFTAPVNFSEADALFKKVFLSK